MKIKTLIIVLSILTFNCNSDNNTTNTEQEISSTLISKDNLYGNGQEGITEQNMVIQNQTDWNNLLTQIDAVNNTTNTFTETDIDFSQYTIIAVFDQIRGNGGHSIDLNITTNQEIITVTIIHINPEGGATTVITQPYHIVKIEKRDLPIYFE
ncbi:protease complex subunit PrcB family protein [Lacinutrix sp. C3R15]|uniref:protease complex subunit PrcB family protein n=1 Tax=Flavobacteriaceae TaxID=49546 RepID=UPI001C09014B|nr:MULTISPECIES: protease complex subunit PrcB family protein [Flavobacteriaceae]MBU2940725.1 protease complex subunit PrcB family protein [Lacinutrix sp. C3R15]MDO6624043.1 protease complex subunit PrcB family protein [Oceanihabitans sp. 1_MG-2023]